MITLKQRSILNSAIIILFVGTQLALGGCATDLVGDPADLTKFETPVGMAIHPNGRYAYVTGSNFNLDYRANDGGALYVVDLETGQLMPSSKRMGSFGTNIVLTEDARRGYTVTRYDDALVWFEISEDGREISCPKAPDSDSLSACRVVIDDDPTYVSLTRSYRETQSIQSNGLVAQQHIDFDLLMIAQLRNARITAMTVIDDGTGDLSFSHETASFVYSASEIQWIGGERFVVTGRSAVNLQVISPAITDSGKVKGLYSKQYMNVPSGNGLYEGRGMTLDPTGQKLYLLNQYPNSLLEFDITGLAVGDAASDKANNTKMVMLPSDVSKIIWVGDANDGHLYVSSVVEDSIYIIDPDSLEIVAVVETGDGPYEMIARDDTLYVLHFLGEDISTFDISDPVHPTDKKVIIGPVASDDEDAQ